MTVVRRATHALSGLTLLLAVNGCLGVWSSDAPVSSDLLDRGGHGALVTFVIDDGYDTDFTVKKPIFDTHGAVAVVAIPTRRRGITDDHLRALAAAGWEIASHGAHHWDETQLADSELTSELRDSKADLEALGLRVTAHVYPYGAYDDRVEMFARRYYQAGIGASGGLNPMPVPDTFAIKRTIYARRYRVSVHPGSMLDGHRTLGSASLRWYESNVNLAREAGAWLVFNVHELSPEEAADLDTLLTYIQQEHVPIVTVRQALGLP